MIPHNLTGSGLARSALCWVRCVALQASVRYIWNRGGVREFYRGSNIAVLRNSSCNAAYFALLPAARETYAYLREKQASGARVHTRVSGAATPVSVYVHCRRWVS